MELNTFLPVPLKGKRWKGRLKGGGSNWKESEQVRKRSKSNSALTARGSNRNGSMRVHKRSRSEISATRSTCSRSSGRGGVPLIFWELFGEKMEWIGTAVRTGGWNVPRQARDNRGGPNELDGSCYLLLMYFSTPVCCSSTRCPRNCSRARSSPSEE
jgi:hypothetical protein